MKIILLQDVPHIGQKGDVKDVKDGFARNLLFPKNLAEVATPRALETLETRKKNEMFQADKTEQMFTETIEKLAKEPLILYAKTTEKGGLFKKIGKKEIQKAITSKGFQAIQESDILLESPLKMAGEHTVEIKRGDTAATVKIIVEGSKK